MNNAPPENLIRVSVFVDTQEIVILTQRLGEHEHCGPDGDICEVKHCLRSNHGLLHAQPNTQTIDNLVADPMGGTAVYLECREKSGTHSQEDGRDIKEGCKVSEQA